MRKNTETDTFVESCSDHYPLWQEFRIKFKAPKPRNTHVRNHYLNPSKENLQQYNDLIRGEWTTADFNSPEISNQLDTSLRWAAEHAVPKKNQKIKKPWISDSTYELIKKKHWLEQEANSNQYKEGL